MVRPALDGLAAAGSLPVVVGGSPLYVKALLDGYDCDGGAPDAALREALSGLPLPELVEILRREAPAALFARTDLTQPRRVVRGIEIARNGRLGESKPLLDDALILMPDYSRADIHRRIEIRLDERLSGGLLEEVRRLHEQGLSWEKMEWLGLEYRFCARHLSGALTYAEMRETLLAHIRQFCKRQEGWFRKFEREGKCIHRIPGGDPAEAERLVADFLGREPVDPESTQNSTSQASQ
jgi:tRNA dimethylallyltransferase